MEIAIKIVIGIVALFHVYVMWLEMFAWTTKGPKTFKNFDKELFPKTKSLAANQGLYNGFLAAGLIWSFFIRNPEWRFNVSMFFLICVAVAGIYGAVTADKKIFFVQALPALIGIALLAFSRGMHDGKHNAACEHKCEGKCDKMKERLTYFYMPNDKRGQMDTVSRTEILKKNEEDSLIGLGFVDDVNGKGIGVSLYTNEHHAPIDGGAIKGYVNGVGEIYSHSVTWRNFRVLHTNNDSINRVIALGLGRLLAMETENKYKSSPPIGQERTISFVDPEK